jgi:hypothetical protein
MGEQSRLSTWPDVNVLRFPYHEDDKKAEQQSQRAFLYSRLLLYVHMPRRIARKMRASSMTTHAFHSPTPASSSSSSSHASTAVLFSVLNPEAKGSL